MSAPARCVPCASGQFSDEGHTLREGCVWSLLPTADARRAKLGRMPLVAGGQGREPEEIEESGEIAKVCLAVLGAVAIGAVVVFGTIGLVDWLRR